MFFEAMEPWLPTLLDIEHFKSLGTPGYENIGFEKLVVPAEATFVTERMSTLTQRFNDRYAHRRVNSETLVRWQVRMQKRMDEIVMKYERAYTLYDLYVDEMNEARTGTTVSSRYTNKNINTPDAAVNASDSYADSLGKGDAETITHADGQTVEDVLRNIDAWRDLDTAFVAEFENLFLNILWD